MVTNWLERIELAANCGGFLTPKVCLQHGIYSTENKIECAIFLRFVSTLGSIAGLMPAYGSENRICILDEPSEGLDEKIRPNLGRTHLFPTRTRERILNRRPAPSSMCNSPFNLKR